MIIVAVLILLYIKFLEPFRHEFNNYFASVSQLFLLLFYGECLVLSVFADDEYTDFKKLLGLCLSIMIFTYMMLQFIAGMVIFFKKCKCKHKRNKNSLSKLIKENGLAMQQIFGAKKSARRLKGGVR